MDSNDSDQMKTNIFNFIASLLALLMNLLTFFVLYFNDSRKQKKSLIPHLIILGCAYQSIISYCCIISTNTSDFFIRNPLPKILNFNNFGNIKIFFNIPEYLVDLMKFFNALIFIISLIACYINEIFYCFESIYLFANPISNTKYRKIIYTLVEFIISIFFGLYAMAQIFSKAEQILSPKIENLLDISYKDIFNDCISYDRHFLRNLSLCSKYAFSSNSKYFRIIIYPISFFFFILGIIYILITAISIIAILRCIKIQTKLFIYEKRIFQTRHILYSIIGIILAFALIIPMKLLDTNKEENYFNEKNDNYNDFYKLIMLSINCFGFSNSVIRFMEIGFCTKINLKEEYNEKAIKQFLILVNNSEEQEKLNNILKKNENEKNNVMKLLENKELNEKNIKETLNPENYQSFKKKLCLSTQIACDFLSEAVYYIVSCITNNAIHNRFVTSIIEENSYTRCYEHILKNKLKSEQIPSDSISNISNSSNSNSNSSYKSKSLNNSKLYIIGDEDIHKETEEHLLLNTSELDNNLFNDNNIKDNYVTSNEWKSKSITLQQAKLGNFCTNFFSKKIRIIEYAPEIFRNILRFDKIDENQIIKSFNVTDNILKLSSFKGSEGKSGSFFFETHDKKFIVKTIREDELKSMIYSLIKPYYTLFSTNVYSNLNRIYGVYTLILGISKVHVVVLENIFPFDKKALICKFDLKGSSLGRKTHKIFDNKGATLKDRDYIELSNKDFRYKIILTDESKDYINQIIAGDLNVLEEARLMDYSFFVCIAKKKDIEKEKDKIIIKDRIYESINKKYVYIVGIIDYLTQFGTKKKIEYKIKQCFNKKRNTMSSINPSKYRQRFTLFLKKCSVL